MRIQFEELKEKIKQALLHSGLSEEQAEICAQAHAEASRDGVYSHGLNRVPRFLEFVRKGWVNLEGKPELIKQVGCMENYDGNLGIGVINARFSMERAIELAKVHGIGMVALRNTTHWMRGGSYAWQATQAGFMSVCWTNATPNMPLWGAKSPAVGNNPLCVGIPYKDSPVILDIAMSQYSYGKIEDANLQGKQLAYAAGYDKDGALTTDPGAILETKRILPAGLWKGSGLSLVLDLGAAILSNGLTGDGIGKAGMGGSGCSQVFMAISPQVFSSEAEVEKILEIEAQRVHASTPVKENDMVTYPGERTLRTRKENLELGIPVDESVWKDVCTM